jgi:hypothetical protein
MRHVIPAQVVSFHSTSKGFTGECGLRGGYFDLVGFEPAVRAEMTKFQSISLCSNVPGQARPSVCPSIRRVSRVAPSSVAPQGKNAALAQSRASHSVVHHAARRPNAAVARSRASCPSP